MSALKTTSQYVKSGQYYLAKANSEAWRSKLSGSSVPVSQSGGYHYFIDNLDSIEATLTPVVRDYAKSMSYVGGS